jgi:hypothetical protein
VASLLLCQVAFRPPTHRICRPPPRRQSIERGTKWAHKRIRHSARRLFQIIHVLPRSQFRHTPSFLGLHYSDDLIILEITFISGRPREKRLALLKTLNGGVVAAAGISPDDLLITLYETAGENISFGRGLAQRAHISDNN